MLTASELMIIQRLTKILDTDFMPPSTPLSFDVKVIDSNGDHIGTIEYLSEVGAHAFIPRSEEQINAD